MSVLNPAAGRALSTEAIIEAGVAELLSARERGERSRVLASIVFAVFEDYYLRSRRMPWLAKAAFERRDWPATAQLSRDRLSIYSISVQKLGPVLKAEAPELSADESFWSDVEGRFLELIRGRYEADLGFAFLHSVRRKVYQDEWRPVAYSYGGARGTRHDLADPVQITFTTSVPVPEPVVLEILEVPKLAARWRDAADDARLVAAEMTRAISRLSADPGAQIKIVMINAGFYRNRGAYLVGRISVPGRGVHPLLVALLHEKDGVYVDAVLFEGDLLQYVFSSTLANFHVTNPHYHELAQFLFSVMPKRPMGLHYSTIGFNHVGKVAVMNEIAREQMRTGELLDTAVGFRGTVAIGFSMPSSRYVLKVIRDAPTDGYKWGAFPGIAAVLDKYRLVHDSDRAGSMLDNIIYTNVKLPRGWFRPELLEELTRFASRSVVLQQDAVVFRTLICQMKLVPLPVFLETATAQEARAAVVNLGTCIKNNAAANIFNKDLDGRNYGVSRILKVHLFDYDAVEPLTDIKVRTNTTRIEGEEDIPDWYFEAGTIFLPEEMMVGLRIDDRELRRAFRDAHPELMAVDYWEGMQRALREGKVPKVRSYPTDLRLRQAHAKCAAGPAEAEACS
jgi:isocitrate dehydrogenase kinase/phosphatase